MSEQRPQKQDPALAGRALLPEGLKVTKGGYDEATCIWVSAAHSLAFRRHFSHGDGPSDPSAEDNPGGLLSRFDQRPQLTRRDSLPMGRCDDIMVELE